MIRNRSSHDKHAASEKKKWYVSIFNLSVILTHLFGFNINIFYENVRAVHLYFAFVFIWFILIVYSNFRKMKNIFFYTLQKNKTKISQTHSLFVFLSLYVVVFCSSRRFVKMSDLCDFKRNEMKIKFGSDFYLIY